MLKLFTQFLETDSENLPKNSENTLKQYNNKVDKFSSKFCSQIHIKFIVVFYYKLVNIIYEIINTLI